MNHLVKYIFVTVLFLSSSCGLLQNQQFDTSHAEKTTQRMGKILKLNIEQSETIKHLNIHYFSKLDSLQSTDGSADHALKIMSKWEQELSIALDMQQQFIFESSRHTSL